MIVSCLLGAPGNSPYCPPVHPSSKSFWEPCPAPKTLSPDVAGPEPQLCSSLVKPCHIPAKTERKKFVDDLTLLEVVSLKDSLTPKDSFIGPLNLHERHGLQLPPQKSIIQHQLEDLQNFTEENEMLINFKKTKVIPFNFSKTKDFIPELSFPASEPLEVVYQTKLVGIIISSNLSWSPHVEYTAKNANSKLWLLVRFKARGGTTEQLLTLFQLKIRTLAEFGAPAFHGALTQQQSDDLEIIQKKAFAIILGPEYKSYNNALTVLNQEKLSTRRLKLCKNFARKCVGNERHADIFPLRECNSHSTNLDIKRNILIN